jgi:hypothetical protein
MTGLVLTLIAMAAIALVFVVLPVGADAYVRYREPRVVRCPKTGLDVKISLDPWHAAATAVPGPPRLHVVQCTLWPNNGGCNEACVAGDHVG